MLQSALSGVYAAKNARAIPDSGLIDALNE
jgi:hypothetical protein